MRISLNTGTSQRKKAYMEYISLSGFASIFAATGFFLKQFYWFSPGHLQLGDCVLLIAAFFAFCINGARIQKIDCSICMYVFFTFVINLLYSLKAEEFFPSILYFLYNALMIVLLLRPLMGNKLFLNLMLIVFRVTLIGQLLIYVLGMGYMYQGIRFAGTYSDPNQYGYAVLCAFLGQYMIGVIKSEKTSWLWLFFAFVNIIISGSRGVLMAFFVFLLTKALLTEDKFVFNKRTGVTIVIVLMILLSLVILWKPIMMTLANSDNPAVVFNVQRTYEKISDGDIRDLIENYFKDRMLMKVVLAPKYFLYGCGEGAWWRFLPITGESYELHSTVISLAYCYGIVPCIFLLKWIANNLKGLKACCVPVYITLFVEALTLVNHRQVLFWFLIMLASCDGAKRFLESDKK